MENGVEIVKNNAPAREIGVITAEIKDLCRQAQTMALLYAVEIGRRLKEAKEVLPYGTWGEWLKSEVEFSQSTANNFMRLYEEYGASQISIFGASVDSQTFANLPYSKALQLLAIPKEERESFAAEVGAEDLSVKELKKAIEERDLALKAIEDGKAREEELADKLAEAEAAVALSNSKEQEVKSLRDKLESMENDLERSRTSAADLRRKLDEAKKDPKIPSATMEKLRLEAEEAARHASEEATKAEMEQMRARVDAAEREAKAAKFAETQAQARLEEAQKRLKTANPAVTEFKTMFESMQDIVKKLLLKVKEIRVESPETAERLECAIKAFGTSLQGIGESTHKDGEGG